MSKRTPFRLVSREEWSGSPPPGGIPIKGPVKFVILSYETPAPKCFTHEECVMALKRLYRIYVIEKGLSDIPFNFLVAHDGTVYEARGWLSQPSRSLKFFPETHGNRIDIGVIGDYTSELQPHQMSDTSTDIIGIGIDKGLVERYYEALEFRDEKRVQDAISEEKRDKPWENWQLKDMAKKIFNKDMEYWEVNEKMKNLIPIENRPTNELCVIL